MILCAIRVMILSALALANGELVYPPGWHNASGSLEGFRIGDHYVIDPWEYHQRLSVYKIIVQETEVAFRSFGPNNSGNILWGLPLQFGWQFSSGRTRDMTNSSKCGFPSSPECVSTKNWWASMNYYLSVVPFLGMVKAGFFQISPTKLEIKPPLSGIDLYCTNFSTCDAMDSELILRWTSFFRLLKNTPVTPISPDAVAILRDKLLSAMWKSHVSSVSVGMRLFKDKLPLMSEKEQAFGLGWANLVTFIAPTLFLTDNENTATNQILYLPGRLLWNSDHPPNAPGLSTNKNKALVVLSVFNRANNLTGGLLQTLWEKAMCSHETRAVGRQMLENIVIHPYETLMQVYKIIKLAVSTC